MRVWILLLLASAAATPGATIAEKTAGMRKMPGFFPMYWDEKAGSVFLEIDPAGEDFLFYTSLAAGLGSNDVGLDRGQIGGGRLMRFERIGPKVLLVEKNTRFRADSQNASERRAVEEAFASSTHWGFKVEAEENGLVLIEVTPFVVRDGHDAAGRLKRTKSGNYRADASRSAIYLDRTRNFPDNTEIEVTLTLTGDPQGRFVGSVAPEPDFFTLREHYSFVRLPPPGYQPRAFDPRSGFIDHTYADYAAPLGEDLMKRLIVRHRLEKKDANADLSDPVKPITYYLDRGTPEPVLSALLEGARWWDQAFTAAGFRNAFRVELLPEGVDPLDIRYNMIHWVHRSTRGWSYGASVVDPRTGEILKGNVTLGSLRMRQDFMIAEGLLSPYVDGKPRNPAMSEMALARLRQLSAHEVGHTIGLAHNFAASISSRASVMDYPHPTIKLIAGAELDLSDAYAKGIGEWDKVAIAYGYKQFASPEQESKGLNAILTEAYARGLRFLSDDEARDPAGSSPVASLWDNGKNNVDELKRISEIRSAAMQQFSPAAIRSGEPMSKLASTLVPVFLLHRYQVEAAIKSIGGVDFNNAVRGDNQTITAIVPAAEQNRALDEVLRTISPQFLEIPEKILAVLPPIAYGFEESREQFKGRAGRTFDAVAAAESSANHTLSLLLNAGRAARLDQLKARDNAQPGFTGVLAKLLSATWNAETQPGMRGEIQKAVNMAVIYYLMALSTNEAAAAPARAQAVAALRSIGQSAGTRAAKDDSWRALNQFAKAQIERFERDPKSIPLPAPLEAPPGQPIGCSME